jgi:hypothetical protein
LDTADKLSDDDRKAFIETARKALEGFSAKPDSKSEPEPETGDQPTPEAKSAATRGKATAKPKPKAVPRRNS